MSDLPSEVADLFARHLYHKPTGGRFGIEDQFSVIFFLDLMEAVHFPGDCERVKQLMLDMDSVQMRAGTAIAGPKRGNGIFVRQVADALGAQSALIRDEPLFGQWVEGCLAPGCSVVLVDDVASEGELLALPVRQLRASGHSVTECFVIVNRAEGDARWVLEQLGVTLVARWDLSDLDFERLDFNRRSNA